MLKEHPEYKEQIKLLPARWEKAGKIKKEEDKLRSLAAGILFSYGLKYAGIDLENCELGRGVHGKPEIKNQDKVHFNLSHTGNYAAATFADFPVGIDIEHRRQLKQPLLEKCCTEGERNWIREQADEEMAFVQIWTAKESYVKWSGEGITFPLKDIEIKRGSSGIEVWRDGIRQPVKILEYDKIPDYHISICRSIQETEPVTPEIVWLPQRYHEDE